MRVKKLTGNKLAYAVADVGQLFSAVVQQRDFVPDAAVSATQLVHVVSEFDGRRDLSRSYGHHQARGRYGDRFRFYYLLQVYSKFTAA